MRVSTISRAKIDKDSHRDLCPQREGRQIIGVQISKAESLMLSSLASPHRRPQRQATTAAIEYARMIAREADLAT